MSGRKIRTLSTRSSHEVSRKPPSESRHFALHQLRGSRITRGCSVPLAFRRDSEVLRESDLRVMSAPVGASH